MNAVAVHPDPCETPFLGHFTAIERPLKDTISNPQSVVKFRACYEQALLFFWAG
jgi:hypothetical protein